MARQRRVEFDGALYHVMARGDRRDPIVLTDDDKVMLAELIASLTSVPLDWLCENLGMGSRSHCSRLINAQRRRLRGNPSLKGQRTRLLKRAIYND